ncbi:MAG: hypothetical protein VW270_26475, partial [Candidatus Poseidoniales archaeon]
METHKPTKYTINYEEEDLKDYYTRQWVWKWVEQFHPEAFKKARVKLMLKTPVNRLYNICMKTTIVKLLAFVAAATLALSVNAADKAPISGSVSTGYATENFYRGADLGDDTLKVGAELRGGVAGLNAFGSVVTDQSI